MQLKYLKYDLYRYFYFSNEVKHISILRKIRTIFLTQGIWATIEYRIRRWFYYECNYQILRKIGLFIGLFSRKIIEILTGIGIDAALDIGPGLYIGHYGNIILGGATKIGKMCNISQECTVGWAGRGEAWGSPEIGDFVYIAPGAKVFGKIKIGNHVAIGANAVVTKSLSDNAVAVGVPAKVISYKGSKDIILWNEDKFRPILEEN
jgi:serine O-acetyltransferase